ncbi:MAG: ATPase [Pirellula sp.]|nr:ATPase [Pirellula sp.]
MIDPLPPNFAPHAASAVDVVARLQTEPARGLPEPEAAARRERWGFNRLPEAQKRSRWQRFLDQFRQFVVVILLVAAVIAGYLGDVADTLAILAIVVLNAALGFFQEDRAERALESMKSLSAPTARVRRNGALQVVAAELLVPGDVVDLEAGDLVPADLRLLEAYALTAQEAALTGESVPVEKDASAVVDAESVPGDRINMLFAGTTIVAGKGIAVVAATGPATELGRIAGFLAEERRDATPLQRRLASLGRALAVACLAIVAVIAALQLLRGLPLSEILLPAVGLAVAAVPESLPTVVTVTLALGLQRLVRRQALVRKLPSVETLGSVTIICSDKTGTLTRNEMTVREVRVGDAAYEVTDAGYGLEGEFRRSDAVGGAAESDDADLRLALAVGLHCNNATLHRGAAGEASQVVGDPTEGALLVAAAKQGLFVDDAQARKEHELPFDSTRKAMSVVVRGADDRRLLYTKGAPEVVLGMCTTVQIAGRAEPLTVDRRATVVRSEAELAGRALRVLGLAYRELPSERGGEHAEENLTFLGLVGMIDPPRDEVRDAVARCREAGVLPVMITGDHPATAQAIARELGILDDLRTGVLTGRQLDDLDEDALDGQVAATAVYARVSAEHKLRIIRAWRRVGGVTAMTGDGVNDAPAIQAADIGIAMGRTGTDVTKAASDMVLMDDNFATIVNAVEEGRGILDNIKKVVHYLLACNAGEVLLMFFAALAGMPVPLTAIQILWINLITDGLPALALATEPPEEDLMRRKPRAVDAALISRGRAVEIMFHGLLVGGASFIAFVGMLRFYPGEPAAAQAVTFCVIAFAQLFYAHACRSRRRNLWQLGLTTNRALTGALALSGVLQLGAAWLAGESRVWTDPRVWALGALALVPLLACELVKWLRRAK